MLKNFPFELLEGGFDDLSNMWPGVVMEQDDLALSIRSFQSKSLIHAAQLQDVEVLVDRDVSFEHFPVHHVFPVPDPA